MEKTHFQYNNLYSLGTHSLLVNKNSLFSTLSSNRNETHLSHEIFSITLLSHLSHYLDRLKT